MRRDKLSISQEIDKIVSDLVYEALIAETSQGAEYAKNKATKAVLKSIIGLLPDKSEFDRTYDLGWNNYREEILKKLEKV